MIIKDIKKIIRKILFSMPTKNIILFESTPDFSDNTMAVFNEMIRRNMNKKYKLVWMMNGEKVSPKIKKYKNVKFAKFCIGNDPIGLYYMINAKCMISCNNFFEPMREGQKSFFLTHGTTIKSVKDYYSISDKIDYVLTASKDVDFLTVNETLVKPEKIFSLGFPRNDVLTNVDIDLRTMFNDCTFDKIIVWYPTYRQHGKTGFKLGGSTLPIIHDSEAARKLNEVAKQNNVLIVLKPHFAQDLSYVKSEQLSNIKFINEKFFEDNNITSYEFVGSCDAMISDYSSIMYDFTLCDKPIALVWEDYEEYKKNPGFAEGTEEFLECGEKIYTLQELEKFVTDVANDVDNLKEIRNKVCDMVNYSRDGKNSERVVDFIIEKSNL